MTGIARLALVAIAAPLVAASSTAAPIDRSLRSEAAQARREAAVAEAEAARLTGLATKARDAAVRLRARQLAAAQAIAAAESRISAAAAMERLVAERLQVQQRELQAQQRPAATLLGGLATMARRPPLLTLVDSRSVDDFVRVRILLDSTLPTIKARSAALAAQVAEGHRLRAAAAGARTKLAAERSRLAERQRDFAALEAQALRSADATQAAALGVGDVALAAGEQAADLSGQAIQAATAQRLARELAMLGPAPAGPGAATVPPPGLDYRLPSEASVSTGFGALSASGIRSRGITIATARGTRLVVPASGRVRFAGPFRSYDGVVIIDHGGGWISLILNLVPAVKAGDRVAAGAPLGRALGAVEIELSRNGKRLSPALIAGSSQNLSNRNKDG